MDTSVAEVSNFPLTPHSNTTLLQTMPGFIRIITAQDIPSGGVNNFVSSHSSFRPEEVRRDY